MHLLLEGGKGRVDDEGLTGSKCWCYFLRDHSHPSCLLFCCLGVVGQLKARKQRRVQEKENALIGKGKPKERVKENTDVLLCTLVIQCIALKYPRF